MDVKKVFNVNVDSVEVLIAPDALSKQVPLSERAFENVLAGRKAIENILDGKDRRIFVVVGPCSIHDPEMAYDYGRRLKKLAEEVKETMLLVMRAYFEKPRTTVGWKGLINDPRMDDSFHIEEGLKLGREVLLKINELGLSAGTEALDPVSPQYMSDLWSWAAIGARTAESQTHREMSSALSMPVGFKNSTEGGIEAALNALEAVTVPHHFLGMNQKGQTAIIRTRGNKYGHIILRGGGGRQNYDSVSVAMAEKELKKRKLRVAIVVDCSHANSNKDYRMQPLVMDNVVNQIVEGNTSIIGVMVESNIHEGNQKIPKDISRLKYGVSITDACVSWETTEIMLRSAHAKLKGLNLKARGTLR